MLHGFQSAQQQPPQQFWWQVGHLQDNSVRPLGQPLCRQPVHGPCQRLIGFGEMASDGSRGQRINECTGAHRWPNAGTVIPIIPIGWIINRGQSLCLNQLLQLGPPPTQQRPQQSSLPGPDAGHAANAARTVGAHDHGFQLVIGMMCSHQPADGVAIAPLLQQRITGCPRAGLHAAADGRRRLEDRMGDAPFGADGGNKPGFLGAFWPQAMVNSCSCHAWPQSGMACQKQRQTVRPS